MRVVLLQAGCAAAVAACSGHCRVRRAARAGLAGGLIVATGSALFGLRMFAPGIAPGRDAAASAVRSRGIEVDLVRARRFWGGADP